MILLLIRILLWGAAIIAVGLAFDFLRDSSGAVSVELNGQVFGPFAPLEFVGVVLALGLLIWLLIKVWGFLIALVRFFAGDETALSRFWNRSRERRGFDAAADGLIALAEGDGRRALVRARKAERLLARPGLTRLLVAQAAQASGDAETARRYYKQLASEPDTAFAGTRGLLSEALKKGETERALKLANHAFSLKPKDGELLTTLFGLQSETQDWGGARRTLTASVSAKSIPRDVAARREAILLLAEAQATEDETARRDMTLQANRRSPALAPAAIEAARFLHAEGSDRKARNVLKEAWRNGPNPDIAAAFAALAPDETPSERRKRFSAILSLLPDDPETRLLAAELALADNDWAGARKALGDLAETAPTTRSLAIMAAIEKGEDAPEAMVRGWLAKAVTASRGPQWICANCGARHAEWGPTCQSCDAFDTLAWTTADDSGDAHAANAAMAPLVAGDDVAEVAAAEVGDGDEAATEAESTRAAQ